MPVEPFDDPFLEQIKAPWFKPHEYVLIQGEMSTEDDIAIQNKLAKVRGQGKEAEITMNLGDVKLMVMQRLVKGWNLTKTVPHGDGTREVPIPYSLANILRLSKRYTDFIYDEINKRNLDPSAEADEQQNFTNAVVDATEDSFETERVLRLKSMS